MRVIQLCGTAPRVSDISDIPGAERWILGAAYQTQGQGAWDRCFDVHQTSHIQAKRLGALAWYAAQTKPVYMLEQSVRNAQIYPRLEVAEHFGPRGASAISSSIDHMMALALYEGCGQIRLDGIRMIEADEWHTQRETLAYWIGRAEGLGVDVITDPLSALAVPELVYGYEEPTGACRRYVGVPLPVLA